MLPNLPELIIELTCGYLSYEDILVLRSTCKGLKQLVDQKKFTKLNLFVKKFSYNCRMFYTNEPINYPHSYHSDDLAIFDSFRFREQFTDLQRLTICSRRIWSEFDDATEFNLNCLNCFRSLRHLEIDEFACLKGELNLPYLRIASFRVEINYQSDGLDSSFELNCTRLQALKIKRCRPVLRSETNQLTYLYYDHFRGRPDYLTSLEPNLRRLSTICFEVIRRSMQFLTDLQTGNLSVPSLIQIRLEKCTDLDRLDELASSLQDLKRDSRTKHIQFIFNGRLIHSPGELRQITSLIRAYDSGASEADRLKLNRLKVRPLLFLNGNPELTFLLSAVFYFGLNEAIELNEKMMEKLKCIETLELRDRCKPSEYTFELLARTCKMLRHLSLNYQILPKRLLEMLSIHLVNLEQIRIWACQYETIKPLAEFRNLEYVDLDFDPPKGELAYLYTNSRTIERVHILGKDLIELLKTTAAHRITIIPSQIFEFDTLQAMIAHYYERGLFEVRNSFEMSTRFASDDSSDDLK